MQASVIIPAHNEEQVIGRLLGKLTGGASPPQVIVVCNGCRDATAKVARSFGEMVMVIETEVPSKANALNLGDAAAKHFPRVYVDADVVIDLASLTKIIEALQRPGVYAASPVPELKLDSASAAVRRFYAVDQVMPSHAGGIGGSGVYAMSQSGRGRFEQFPRITADDAFVRRHFKVGERVVVEDARSIVTPPATLAGLITIKTRSHFGNIEIGRMFKHLNGNKGRGNRSALTKLAVRPGWLLAVATYLYVKATARVRARRQARRLFEQGGSRPAWDRDDTSRVSPPAII